MKWGKVPPPKQNKGGKQPPIPPEAPSVVVAPPEPVKSKRVFGSLHETAEREHKTMYQVRKERSLRRDKT